MNYFKRKPTPWELERIQQEIERNRQIKTRWLFKGKRELRDQIEIEKSKAIHAKELYESQDYAYLEMYEYAKKDRDRLLDRIEAMEKEHEILVAKYSRLMNRYILATDKYVKE